MAQSCRHWKAQVIFQRNGQPPTPGFSFLSCLQKSPHTASTRPHKYVLSVSQKRWLVGRDLTRTCKNVMHTLRYWKRTIKHMVLFRESEGVWKNSELNLSSDDLVWLERIWTWQLWAFHIGSCNILQYADGQVVHSCKTKLSRNARRLKSNLHNSQWLLLLRPCILTMNSSSLSNQTWKI